MEPDLHGPASGAGVPGGSGTVHTSQDRDGDPVAGPGTGGKGVHRGGGLAAGGVPAFNLCHGTGGRPGITRDDEGDAAGVTSPAEEGTVPGGGTAGTGSEARGDVPRGYVGSCRGQKKNSRIRRGHDAKDQADRTQRWFVHGQGCWR